MKRRDECLFCRNRFCYDRVVSSEDYGQTYDEIACLKHANDLLVHSDSKVPGVKKCFISGSKKKSRRDMSDFVLSSKEG